MLLYFIYPKIKNRKRKEKIPLIVISFQSIKKLLSRAEHIHKTGALVITKLRALYISIIFSGKI